jgi:predicted phage terminase large subunit-like protein
MAMPFEDFTLSKKVVNALLREDFRSFIHRCFQTVSPGETFFPNWHIDAIAHHLRLCMDGEIRRLIITMPPRSLKSICASVAFPAFLLGLDPTARVIGVSYSEKLATKHSRDCRAVMKSKWYSEVFPRTRVDPKKDAETEFETTLRGYRYTTSVNGTLTGRGGNFIIVDDPIKVDDAASETLRMSVQEWFTNSVLSRLDNKRDGVIIVVMQRLHVDDLAGKLLTSGNWVHLDLPAIATEDEEVPVGPGEVYQRREGDVLHPTHEPLDVLKELEAGMGSIAFSAQYQQSPVPLAGNMIKRDWLRSFVHLPSGTPSRVVQSWDTASKPGELSDYSVCTSWHVYGKDYYLVDVYRKRLDFPSLKRQIMVLKNRHNADVVLIEDAGSGTGLIQELKAGNDIRPIGIKPEKDKVTRLSTQSAKIEAGQIFLPLEAPWLDDFVKELLEFPDGKHDDQVDSLSQFLNWIEQRVTMQMVKVRA